MHRVPGLATAVAAGLLAGCTGAPREDLPAPSTVASSNEEAHVGDIVTGPVPDDLDARIERRDTSPLPPGALVRFQRINRGPSPAINYRWILYDDGRLFVARHSGDTSDPSMPFDTPLPDNPTRVLDAAEIARIASSLQESGFVSQPAYQTDPGVENGVFSVVTARVAGGSHEVIYEAVYRPPVTTLEAVLEGDEEE